MEIVFERLSTDQEHLIGQSTLMRRHLLVRLLIDREPLLD